MDFSWSDGHKVADIDVEEGIYDIMINTYDFMNSGDEMYVFLHALNVNTNIDTTINLTEAADHYLYFHGMDENHNLLLPGDTTLITNDKLISIEFPAPSVFQSATFSIGGLDRDYVRFSDVDPAFKILACQSNVKQGKMYILDFGHLNGISADTVLESNPDIYKKMTNVFFKSPSAGDNYLTFSQGIISRLRDDPYYWMNTAFGSDNSDYPSHDRDSLTVYLNNVFQDSYIVNFVGGVNFWETLPEYGTPEKNIRSKLFYITTGDTIQFCWFYPPAKADYNVISNSTVNFGNSTPYINTYSANDATTIFNYSDIFGQSNEIRALDNYSSMYYIKQGTDILQSDTLFNFQQPYTIPSAGPYSFSITDSNYYIRGLQGKITSQNNFNLPSTDPDPPMLTSFKVLRSDGLICESFTSSEQASLHFSAVDMTGNEIHNVNQVHVYYKMYDEETFIPLEVQEKPENFDSIFHYGQYFISDLTPIIASCTDTSFIDLKIVLIDDASNIAMEISHPAFQVREVGVGIGEKTQCPTNLDLKVFPNPVNNSSKITFNLYQKSEVKMKICSPACRYIGTALNKIFETGKHTVNLYDISEQFSNLSPGIYLLRVETNTSVETVKLIVY